MRSKYLLPCRCGEHVTVTPAQAGERFLCPSCGTELDVPSLRDMRDLQKAQPAAGRRAARRWGVRGALMFVGSLATGLSLAILCYLWVTWPKPPDANKMTLTESWWAWMDLRQGLDSRLSWYTAHYIEAFRLRRVHIYMTLFGAVIGLATTLTAFVLRKSRTAAAVNRRAGRLKATLLEE